MRLKRLELQGFKSFMDRTVLTFDQAVTGVVGPNGCGKSNIVDAIQWVMGEQSAKHLRGDSMTDVIFNGSDSKQPMSMAEVSLVLDRQGVPLAPQFAAFDKAEEISVTRRVYRDGTGEYFINKTPCRLKDIHELFMDTGVGKRAYSIIEQGQIDRMINTKPEDRRVLFEEVAGITKYKAKRKEAEKKLEATRANMVRLQDIITELEKQIRSLKIQATRARKYKEIKTELEAVDLFLLGKNLFTHKKNIEEVAQRRDVLVNERSQSDAEFSRIDASVTELEIQRIEQEKSFQQLSTKERDLSLEIQRLENQVNILDERKKHLTLSFEASKSEEVEIAREIELLYEQVENEQRTREEVQGQLVSLEDEVSRTQDKLEEQQAQRQRAQNRKEQLQDKRSHLANRSVTAEQQKEHAGQKENEYSQVRAELNQKLTDIVVTIETHKEALKGAEEKIENCALRAGQAEGDVKALHSECETVSARLSELEDGLYRARENFHAQKSRLDSLKELQENLEGYSPTAREILKRLDEGGEVQAIPLAEVLQPEADIEEHLETLLDLDMNTLLVRTSDEAKRLTEMVTAKELERVRILALSDMENAEATPGAPMGSIPLLSKIRVQQGYENAVQWWLGKAFLCNDTTQLFDLRQQYPAWTFLTRDSKTIAHEDRSITTGKLPTQMGVFARRREIEELGVHCQGLEEDLTRITTERENTLQHLQAQERLHSELKDKLSSLHIESVEYRKEREKIQLELSRADRDYTGLVQQSERNIQQIDQVRAQIEKLNGDLERYQREEAELLQEMAATDEEIANSGKDYDSLIAFIHEKKVERSALNERVNSLNYKVESLQSEIETQTQRREQLQAQQARDEKELRGIDDSVVEVKNQRELSEKEKDSTVVQLSDMKNAFNETCHKLQEFRDQRTELQRRRDEVLAEAQELEIKLAHEQSTYEHLVSISNERYQREASPLDEAASIDLTGLPFFVEQLSVEWAPLPEHEKKGLLEEHLKNLREKVSRYGEVNLTAIQEFEEIQTRYDFLMAQKTDLEKSIAILEEAIKKIEETTKVRFEETFVAVNAKFKEIFPILFNGGKAELALVTQEGHTDQGVDIMASPPGKRLQSITLLSGGEKALTAVSLILAIFARKPSPFCLLDEVDAPLDDANVSRFNTVIRKMAEKTQFIVITHNKKTMEIAEALYGVTMERAGISKMTSVRLN
jgi:chromosome segregation protein